MRERWGKVILPALLCLMPISAGAAGESSPPAKPAAIVCVECHSTLPGKYGEPVGLWQGSIHAANGIACNDCHGGDPKDSANAMSRSRGFLGAPKETAIPSFCGRCHVGILKDYLASGHGRRLGRGGPTCVTCHGNHKVVKASLDLINEKSCSRCHSFERARVLREAMLGPERMISSLDGRIAAYKRSGTDVDRLEKSLFAVRNRSHALFHDLEVEKVRTESARIMADLEKISRTVQGMDESRHRRKVAGGFAVAGALLAAGLCHLLRKSMD